MALRGSRIPFKASKQIEKAGEPHFIEALSIALGDVDRYVKLRKQEAQSISAKPEPGPSDD